MDKTLFEQILVDALELKEKGALVDIPTHRDIGVWVGKPGRGVFVSKIERFHFDKQFLRVECRDKTKWHLLYEDVSALVTKPEAQEVSRKTGF